MDSLSPVTVNLASEPFQRERAQNAALAGIAITLACLLLVLLTLILRSRGQADEMRSLLQTENVTLERLQAEQARYSRLLSEPQNADVFAWSVLLNQLIVRRGVSWTQVFEDLSTVMPHNMRLVGIRLPQIAASDASGTNRVQLDMVVATDQAITVVDLLKALQRSDKFGAATVTTETSPTKDDPVCKFRVLVAYAQKV